MVSFGKKCIINTHALAAFVSAIPFICKNLCRFSSSWAPAVTFAVPLCILNVDIPAHISDDLGVFIQGDGVSGSSSPHWGRGCGYTDDTRLLRLLYVCMRMCMCAFVWTSFPANIHGLTWLIVALPVSEFISPPKNLSVIRICPVLLVQLESLSIKISVISNVLLETCWKAEARFSRALLNCLIYWSRRVYHLFRLQ